MVTLTEAINAAYHSGHPPTVVPVEDGRWGEEYAVILSNNPYYVAIEVDKEGALAAFSNRAGRIEIWPVEDAVEAVRELLRLVKEEKA